MSKRRTQPAPAEPVKAAQPLPTPPVALSPEVRQAVQNLLVRITHSTQALRQAGAFEMLGLMMQAGHALKLVTEHSHKLEQQLGLEPPPAPPAVPAKPNTNGAPS